MNTNFEDNLKKFINDIIIKYNDNFINYINDNNKINNLNITKVDNLYVLTCSKLSDNLIHNDLFINTLIHNLEYCIFDITLDFIIIKKKYILLEKPYNSSIINNLKNNWDKIKIYQNVGFNTIIFKYDNITYFFDIYDNTIKNIIDDKIIYNNFLKLNKSLNNNEYKDINIVLNKYNHLLYYNNNEIIEEIYINFINHMHFSCFDELIFEIENISKNNEIKKKLTINGFIIKYDNDIFIINTYIYQKIHDMMILTRNINEAYLELYKNDNLNFAIYYMTPYTHEIIKRVNISIKTLSKEFLNIYHITRKKSNAELYNILTNNYKTILFDLHKIFIMVRQNEKNIENSDEFFFIKKSLNHEIIYKYLKKININLLSQIYIDRLQLIENISKIKIDIDNITFDTSDFKILFNDCINTKTMGYLLKL